ncbi:MAG: hypothetical protein ACR2MY_04985 [Candidatus Dormibacteria bacterium]
MRLAAYRPLTLVQVAGHIRERPEDDERAFRLCLEFLDEFTAEPRKAQPALIEHEAGPTGTSRWDAFLGALAEHLAFHAGFTVPAWAQEPARFLGESWFLSDLPSARPSALAESPAAFRRRAIWLTAEALDRA